MALVLAIYGCFGFSTEDSKSHILPTPFQLSAANLKRKAITILGLDFFTCSFKKVLGVESPQSKVMKVLKIIKEATELVVMQIFSKGEVILDIRQRDKLAELIEEIAGNAVFMSYWTRYKSQFALIRALYPWREIAASSRSAILDHLYRLLVLIKNKLEHGTQFIYQLREVAATRVFVYSDATLDQLGAFLLIDGACFSFKVVKPTLPVLLRKDAANIMVYEILAVLLSLFFFKDKLRGRADN